MSLYDITNGGPNKVDPAKAEAFKYIQKIIQQLHARTFQRVIQTIDDELDGLKPSESSKLVWTKTGALIGHGSTGPKKHIDHVWENVSSAFGGNGRSTLIGVGSLVRWRISLRPETWLVYRRESDIFDEISQKLVTISEYWINEDFIPPDAPASKANLSDLQKKFSGGKNEEETTRS